MYFFQFFNINLKKSKIFKNFKKIKFNYLRTGEKPILKRKFKKVKN